MKSAWLAAGLLALLGSAANAQDGGSSLVGREAPEISTPEWMNGDGRTAIADFRGEVVLIEAWATW